MIDKTKTGHWAKHHTAMEAKLGKSLVTDRGELAQIICEYQETHPQAPLPFVEVSEAMLLLGDYIADGAQGDYDGVVKGLLPEVAMWRNYRAFQKAYAETTTPSKELLEDHEVNEFLTEFDKESAAEPSWADEALTGEDLHNVLSNQIYASLQMLDDEQRGSLTRIITADLMSRISLAEVRP